jgi:hypothetical protein
VPPQSGLLRRFAPRNDEAILTQPAGGLAITPRTNRILTAVIFAVLWSGGMLLRATVLDLKTVTTAVVIGVIVAFVVYWLLDKFSGRLRG